MTLQSKTTPTTAALSITLLLLTGCAEQGGASGIPTIPGLSTEQLSGLGVGAALGGIVGAVVGKDDEDKEDQVRSAAIGAGVGALTGYLAGTYVTQRRNQYASTEAYYTDQIADAQTFNSDLGQAVASLQSQIDANENDVQQFEAQYASFNIDQNLLEQEYREAENRTRSAEIALADAENNLLTIQGVYQEAQRESVQTAQTYGNAQNKVTGLSGELATQPAPQVAQSALPELNQQISKARDQIATLRASTDRSRNQRDRLSARRLTGGVGTSF